MLDKNAILNANDLKTEVVDVPEWGGQVLIRVMSGGERDRFEILMAEQKKTNKADDIRAKFASMVICDEQGSPIFNTDDVTKLSAKSWTALQRVFEAGLKLNAVGAEQIEALEKN